MHPDDDPLACGLGLVDPVLDLLPLDRATGVGAGAGREGDAGRGHDDADRPVIEVVMPASVVASHAETVRQARGIPAVSAVAVLRLVVAGDERHGLGDAGLHPVAPTLLDAVTGLIGEVSEDTHPAGLRGPDGSHDGSAGRLHAGVGGEGDAGRPVSGRRRGCWRGLGCGRPRHQPEPHRFHASRLPGRATRRAVIDDRQPPEGGHVRLTRDAVVGRGLPGEPDLHRLEPPRLPRRASRVCRADPAEPPDRGDVGPVVDVPGEGAASDPQGFHLPCLTRRPRRTG